MNSSFPTEQHNYPPSATEDIKEEDENGDSTTDPPLARNILQYCKNFSNTPFSKGHFFKYLKDNRVPLVAQCRVITQLKFFVEQYYKDTPLFKSLPIVKGDRYHPYQRSPPKAVKTFNAKLPRSNSFNMKFGVDGAQIVVGPGQPVNINMNFFQGLSNDASNTAMKPGLPKVPVDGMINVQAYLPDDGYVVVPMKTSDTVSELRFQLRNMMLQKYPAKRPQDIPLDRLTMKTEGGWDLNMSDTIQEVILEGKIVKCVISD